MRRIRAAALPDGTPDASPAAQAGTAADLDRPVDVLVFEVGLGNTIFIDCTARKGDAPAALQTACHYNQKGHIMINGGLPWLEFCCHISGIIFSLMLHTQFLEALYAKP